MWESQAQPEPKFEPPPEPECAPVPAGAADRDSEHITTLPQSQLKPQPEPEFDGVDRDAEALETQPLLTSDVMLPASEAERSASLDMEALLTGFDGVDRDSEAIETQGLLTSDAVQPEPEVEGATSLDTETLKTEGLVPILAPKYHSDSVPKSSAKLDYNGLMCPVVALVAIMVIGMLLLLEEPEKDLGPQQPGIELVGSKGLDIHIASLPPIVLSPQLQSSVKRLVWTSGNGAITGTGFPLGNYSHSHPVNISVELWAGGATGSQNHCADTKDGGAGGYVRFALVIDPDVYGEYIFYIGGPGEDSYVTWSQFQMPEQVDGPLGSTSTMPGGPFTCAQLAEAESCSVANGQCCESCRSEDSDCEHRPFEVARARAGTTGAVQSWQSAPTSCYNCYCSCPGCKCGTATQSTGGAAVVSDLMTSAYTIERPGNASGSATVANGFSAGGGGRPAVSHVSSTGSYCRMGGRGSERETALPQPGEAGLAVFIPLPMDEVDISVAAVEFVG